MNDGKLRGLSLFSGIGGIELALSEWVKTVAYCEIDPYAQAILRSRMQKDVVDSKGASEGSSAWNSQQQGRTEFSKAGLDTAIIFPDITKLTAADLPQPIDIITGGFPCQDISNAGKRAGIQGKRSGLWFEMHRLIGELRPRYVFVENVGALLNRGMDTVCGSLAEIGYDAVWTALRASDVGAPHRRERIFILAYSVSNGCQAGHTPPLGEKRQGEQGRVCELEGGSSLRQQATNVSNTSLVGCRGWEDTNGIYRQGVEKQKAQEQPILRGEAEGCDRNRGGKKDVAYPTSDGCVEKQHQTGELGETLRQAPAGQPCGAAGSQGASWWQTDPADLPDPSKQGLEGQEPASELPGGQQGCPAECDRTLRLGGLNSSGGGKNTKFAETEPRLGLLVDGLPETLDGCGFGYTPRVTSETAWRVERLKCLGNAVIPQQAREAFIRLMQIREILSKRKLNDGRNRLAG